MEEKIGFFNAFVKACTDFKSYKQLSKRSGISIFLVALFVTMISTICIYILPTARFIGNTDKIIAALEKELPEFELKNGKLTMEEEYFYESYGQYYIEIDTKEKDLHEKEKSMEFYETGLFMNSDIVILKSNNKIQKLYFSDMPQWNVDKQSVLSVIPRLQTIFWLGAAFIFLIFLIDYYFSALMFSVIVGFPLSSVKQKGLQFGELFNISMHMNIIAKLLMIVFIFVNVPLIINWIITFVIMIFIMLMILDKWESNIVSSNVYTNVQTNFYNDSMYNNQGTPYDPNNPMNNGYNQGTPYDPNNPMNNGYNQGTPYDHNNPMNNGYNQGTPHNYNNPMNNGYNQGTPYDPNNPMNNGYNQGTPHNYNNPMNNGYNQGAPYDHNNPMNNGYNQGAPYNHNSLEHNQNNMDGNEESNNMNEEDKL